MSKRAHSLEVRIEVINTLKDGILSVAEIMRKYKVSRSAIRIWKYKYDMYGFEGLKESTSWKTYPKNLKILAMKDYLSGHYSLEEIAKRYNISDESVLRLWLKKYNSHSEIKDTSKERTSSMTKGRKTTWKERMQVVLDCLGNGKDYQKTADTFQVSYQQVYTWVKKYEESGEEGLQDKRGRNKTEIELTPEEKMKLEMKKLAQENERLRAENLFLKKLEELERRRK